MTTGTDASVRLEFDDLAAATTASSDFERRECTVYVDMSPPSGQRLALTAVEVRGSAVTDVVGNAWVVARFRRAGETATGTTHDVPPDFSGGFAFDSNPWEQVACGAEVLRLTVILDAERTGAAALETMVVVDTLVLPTPVWVPCP